MNSEKANLNPFTEASMYPDYTAVVGHGIVKKYDIRVSQANKKFVDVVIADSTGEISGKFFNYEDGKSQIFKPGELVGLDGQVKRYNGAFQITINDVWPAPPSIKIEDYIKSAKYSSDDMYAKIIEIVSTFEDTELKDLTLSIYEKYKEKLLYYPAAMKMHHAMYGGLLLHSLSIMTLAEKVCEVYPQVDRDLLLCGAALHDIGKISELDANEIGIASEYTIDGNLVGHLVRGAMIVRIAGTTLKTSNDKLRLVEHMLLSHHGEPEFGAAVRPKFLEAVLLNILDNMDAKVYEFSEIESGLEPKTFSGYQRSLSDIKIYNPDRKDVSPDVELL